MLYKKGIVFLDQSFNIIALDSGAEAILADLNGPKCASDALPKVILNFLNGLSGRELDQAFTRLNVGNSEYNCRTVLLKNRDEFMPQSRSMLGLYLRREQSMADAVHQLGRDYHLTAREQEALLGVTLGLTSKELAVRMRISPNTVKAFLRLIMIKMGVTTRAGIVGELLRAKQRGDGQFYEVSVSQSARQMPEISRQSTQPVSLRRVGPGNFTPSRSQNRT
jgi:DNA-binding CsgD family transcriptional regulator